MVRQVNMRAAHKRAGLSSILEPSTEGSRPSDASTYTHQIKEGRLHSEFLHLSVRWRAPGT